MADEGESINYGLDETQLTKTERRKLAKKLKKERQIAEGTFKRRQKKKKNTKEGEKHKGKGKPAESEQKKKMTKEERKEKYTQIAREMREKKRVKQMNVSGSKKKVLCFGCRKWGHSLALCPNIGAVTSTEQEEEHGSAGKKRKRKVEQEMHQLVCYNCGSSNHALRNCKSKIVDGGMRFATCFLCKAQGHLSATCPQNEHGIYPKGGQCKSCGSKHHLVSQCPEKSPKENDNDSKSSIEKRGPKPKEDFLPRHQSGGGDDLEDDFEVFQETIIMDDVENGEGETVMQAHENTQPKKKKGRTVNF
mmetsp:Transcript_22109/g.28632  ORF Transcript_22109/g.28632 Transcript_22109/m.28632 type:complete len:305 (+) Transcript_22109:86-1000(+)